MLKNSCMCVINSGLSILRNEALVFLGAIAIVGLASAGCVKESKDGKNAKTDGETWATVTIDLGGQRTKGLPAAPTGVKGLHATNAVDDHDHNWVMQIGGLMSDHAFLGSSSYPADEYGARLLVFVLSGDKVTRVIRPLVEDDFKEHHGMAIGEVAWLDSIKRITTAPFKLDPGPARICVCLAACHPEYEEPFVKDLRDLSVASSVTPGAFKAVWDAEGGMTVVNSPNMLHRDMSLVMNTWGFSLTGEGVFTVAPDVTEAQAAAGGSSNNFSLALKRTGAIALCTTTIRDSSVLIPEFSGTSPKSVYPVGGDNDPFALLEAGWSVSGFETSSYVTQRADGRSPMWGWIPTAADVPPLMIDNGHVLETKVWDWAGWQATPNYGKYAATDIAGKVPSGYPNMPGIYPYPQNLGVSLGFSELDNITGTFTTRLTETTHKSGTTEAESGYRRGNTAHVRLKCIIRPTQGHYFESEGSSVAGDKNFAMTNDTLWYDKVGNIFYETRPAGARAEPARYVGYLGGLCFYQIWLNPDRVGADYHKALNSPVYRNNIYHVNITGFSKLGTPEPIPDPDKPLSDPETSVSVETTVIPWGVHSVVVVAQ